MVSLFLRTVDLLSKVAALIAGLLLIAAMLVICEMIFLRYVFRAPTIWQTDFVVFSATAAMFLGAPYVLKTRGHVGVDVIEIALPRRPRRVLGIVGALLGLTFTVLMAYASAIFFHEAYVNEWRTSTVAAITLWIPLLPLPVSFALLSLQYVAELVRRVCGTDEAEGHA
ncbi:TRAP-type C4-dicarboxylate transport system permease small subunit [Ancylobacter aquaticus]|uniref:TRAP transporter small permease protein n=1 Tax=Ancylobacter aquaticus TaxID=100 RepID=A0A4R1I7A9_ANCAQ|nr:TRAP transporter small permease [Ancylobacter aquaticus]TCK30878.1 TRAP-type C4-dicarboxylate transport system permease small subunit [Ancylobacter aquaticus]